MADPHEAPARRLARSLAVHLRHLREMHGVRYVSAAPLPLRLGAALAAPHEGATVTDEAAGSGELSLPTAAAPAPLRGAPERRPDSAASAPPATPPRSPAVAAPPPAPPPTAAAAEATAAPKTQLRAEARQWTPARKLEYLRDKNLGACTRCPLSRTRTKIVFGVGNPEADLMFIGEAPGHDEDLRGEPFVGRAGQRLNMWLRELGMSRDQVYIANVLKCRPPGNRDPEPEEVARCSPFLQAQIRAVEPRVIVALGRYAGMFLLGGEDRKMHAMRGRSWTYTEPQSGRSIPVVVTYHPSYVLRREREEPPGKSSADQAVLADLRQALAVIRAPRG